ncbi:MAG: sensor histidine kinase [Burkholderiales bacterium]|nr:sensor histidine kinase [Burkholderiales bacterium]
MSSSPEVNEELAKLACHLAERREAILQAWRQAARNDGELNAAASLSHAQFNDHIPEVLEAFERKLSARRHVDEADAEAEQKERASGHGLHRWQQGYNQREVMREWGHLQLCLVDELENYAAAHPPLEKEVMPIARRALTELCAEGIVESAAQYARLQQTEAAGRVRDLEQALVQLQDWERERGEVLRAVAHDLRGNLGIVKNATALLKHESGPTPQRAQFVAMLQNGIGSLHALLNDLTSLAHLEAGHEQRNVELFDVAATIAELCTGMRSLADERRLFLKTEGAAQLIVEGDPVKVQRIVQNLLLNALKYTEQGGVKVTWGEASPTASERWMVCIQDTGPGFQAGTVTPLARALNKATQDSHEVEEKAEAAGDDDHTEPAPTLASQSTRKPAYQAPGEGIGLSIVKRLCELLDASLELETAAGEGTTFRVVFPRRYHSSGE